ncbi:hypothetical protein EYE42_06075 [Paracoccus subflavus]|uniref:Uncharacterized protein n=1 Tax=Paracoccus subflavus TaxID=2528244 RepID=A0A4Q9G5R3_9RHOB|nr:hypothetical protein [Paracoccus subflavus]TBN41964.1 hypothetical protein EYE42_06075 [Paracoccus subflavus]
MYFKYCSQEHLPHISNNIRLGTLSDYRKIDDNLRADPQEGMLEVILNFDNANVSKEWYADLLKIGVNKRDVDYLRLGNTGAQYKTSYYVDIDSQSYLISVQTSEKFSITASQGGRFSIIGTITIGFQQTDGLIFSMSTAAEVPTFKEGNDSLWSIPQHGMQTFAEYLRDVMQKFHNGFSVPERRLRVPPNFNQLQREAAEHGNFDMKFLVRHGPVNYLSPFVVIKTEADFNRTHLEDIIEQYPFTKRRRFAFEREYRISLKETLIFPDGSTRAYPGEFRPMVIGISDLSRFGYSVIYQGVK